jgi:hypothetical protein
MGHKPTCRGLTSRRPRVTNRNEGRYDVQPRTDGLARQGWFRKELEPCEWKLSCTVLRGKGFVRIWTTRCCGTIRRMLWIHLIKGIKDKTDDPNLPVLMEIERRRPGHWRRHYTQVAALFFLLAVLIFFWLRGWQLFLP